MAKKRRSGTVSISLFPFLCILLCSIGVVISIIVGFSLISLSNPHVSIVTDPSVNEEDTNPRPDGNHREKPIYVECHQDMLIIHPEKLRVPIAKIENKDYPFIQLLKRMLKTKKRRKGNIQFDEYFMFAVYPDGIKSFKKAKSLLKRRGTGIKIGYEPYDDNWVIDVE